MPTSPDATRPPMPATAELDGLMQWLQTAQQSLPAMDDAELRGDQMVALATLIDRMQRRATRLRASTTPALAVAA